MLFPLSALLSFSIAVSVRAEILTFEDDRGKTFTRETSEGKARVGVRAGVGGVSLFHMGMTADQLTASWGLWGIRGSDYDPEDPQKGSMYPDADPGVEETAFLASSVNLSLSCWKNPRGCFRFDNVTDVIALKDQIDYLLLIDNGGSGFMQAEEGNGYLAAEDAGMEWIFIDTFYDKNPLCRASNDTSIIIDVNQCFGRSMIDIVQRIEELAIFLGADVDMAELEVQKQAACNAATTFTRTMEEFHQKDMRIKVAILGSELDQKTGFSSATIRDFDPTTLWVPRTLEELGAPLLHAAAYGEDDDNDIMADDYFVDCEPGLVNETCNGNTLFPVDFWFIDSRSFRLVDETFLKLFPDRAMVAGQYWHYPRNDGPLSYKSIEALLTVYNTRLSKAVKVTAPSVIDSECKGIDPKGPWSKYEGLGPNEFICYNKDLIQQEYLKCPSLPSSDNSSSSNAISASHSKTIIAGFITIFMCLRN